MSGALTVRDLIIQLLDQPLDAPVELEVRFGRGWGYRECVSVWGDVAKVIVSADPNMASQEQER